MLGSSGSPGVKWERKDALRTIGKGVLIQKGSNPEKINMISSYRGFPTGSAVKNLPTKPEMQVWPQGQGDPQEKEMATYSSILAWEIPWTEEPGRIQSMGSQRVGHDLRLNHNSGYQQQRPEGNGQSVSKGGKIQSLSFCFSLLHSPALLCFSLCLSLSWRSYHTDCLGSVTFYPVTAGQTVKMKQRIAGQVPLWKISLSSMKLG